MRNAVATVSSTTAEEDDPETGGGVASPEMSPDVCIEVD